MTCRVEAQARRCPGQGRLCVKLLVRSQGRQGQGSQPCRSRSGSNAVPVKWGRTQRGPNGGCKEELLPPRHGRKRTVHTGNGSSHNLDLLKGVTQKTQRPLEFFVQNPSLGDVRAPRCLPESGNSQRCRRACGQCMSLRETSNRSWGLPGA